MFAYLPRSIMRLSTSTRLILDALLMVHAANNWFYRLAPAHGKSGDSALSYLAPHLWAEYDDIYRISHDAATLFMMKMR